jgi:hypothetical protein
MPVWWVGRGRFTMLILLASLVGGLFILMPALQNTLQQKGLGPNAGIGVGLLLGAILNFLLVVRGDVGNSSLYSIPVKAWSSIMLVLGLGYIVARF